MLCPIEGAVHWRGRPAWRRSGTRAPARAPGWHVRCFPRPVEAGAIHREDSHEAHSARARSLLARRGVGRRAVPRVAGSAELGFGGGGVMVGIPVGEFRNFVDVAGGLGGVIGVNLDRRGSVGLRLTGSYLQYGHERRPVALAGTGGLLGLDLNTAFYIASLRAGPQFVFGEGPVRLYGFGTAGVSYFATETSLGGSGCGCWGYPSTVNYDDAVLALEGGGGLLIKLSRAVALDLGASYVRNGPVTYLREGSISRAADGSLVLRPVRSDANLAVAQLGVVIGLR